MDPVSRLYARSGFAHLWHIVSKPTEGCAVRISMCGHNLYPERTVVSREVPERVCERCEKAVRGA